MAMRILAGKLYLAALVAGWYRQNLFTKNKRSPPV
jgi:hypothetical protein